MWSKDEVVALYQAIPHRKSTRSFQTEALGAEVLAELEEQLGKLVPLFDDQPITLRILNDAQVKGRVSKGASYLVAYAGQGLESFANAGFMLEQAALWLTSREIATWFHGLIEPVPQYAQADGLPFCFMLTFGNADGEALRLGEGEFNRKPVLKFTRIEGVDELVFAVRLAPSATNRQPWFLAGSIDALQMHCKRQKVPLRIIAPYVEYIDAGIGLCHLWAVATAEGKAISFAREAGVEPMDRKSDYICTAQIV